MLTPKFDRSGRTGQTDGPTRSDRPGQFVQKVIWTSLLDSSRRGNQDPYIERPIRSPNEGDMASRRSAPRAGQLDRIWTM